MLPDTSDLLDEIFERLQAHRDELRDRLEEVRDRLEEVRDIELPDIDLPGRPDLPDLSGLFSSSDWLLG